jgi:hypothetical protein
MDLLGHDPPGNPPDQGAAARSWVLRWGCYGTVPTAWRIRGGRPPVLRPVRMPADGGPAADPASAAAIAGLRQHSTPCHLARGLLDYAEYPSHLDDDEAAGAAIGQARDIVGRLRCPPRLDCAADLLPAQPRIRAPMVTAPSPGQSTPARDGRDDGPGVSRRPRGRYW